MGDKKSNPPGKKRATAGKSQAAPEEQPQTARKKARSPSKKAASGKAPRRRGRESRAARRERTAEIVARLRAEYPDAHCSLDHRDPFELLAATILSAQCTDERVNMVTPELFARFPDPEQLAGARQEEVEDLVRTTGFFRNKAKSLVGMAEAVTEHHGGRIPRTMEELTALPGVGRKTANVVLGNAFGLSEGIVVDTHVKRLSARLGLTRETDPEKIERDLMPLVEREDWTDISHLFIYHGRAVCKAPTPRCEACVLTDLCPSSRV